MALTDTAMVLALWAAFGAFRPVATVDMTTTFLRPAPQVAIVAEATVLRLGRTMGFCHVWLRTDTTERPLVAHSVGSYSIPPAS
jgi:acyl-coenzyme A thioesterase PaaI-like protein